MKIIKYILFFSFFSLLNSMELEVKYGYSLRENGKGYREKDGSIVRRQEDAVKCIQTEDYQLFCLFDGHGGDLVSKCAQDNVRQVYDNQRAIVNSHDKLLHTFAVLDNSIPEDDEIRGLYYGSSGSTALMAHIEKEKGQYILTLAHAGDSRAVLEQNNKVAYETIDHDCNNAKERDRIIALGGEITKGSSGTRVCGIEVTRALGDKDLRENLIIPDPEISRKIILTPDNKFLISASDGVWKVISSNQAIAIIMQALNLSIEELQSKYPDNPIIERENNQLNGELDEIEEGASDGPDGLHLQLVARALCYEAVKAGSTDNISVVIARFLWNEIKACDAHSEARNDERQAITEKPTIDNNAESYSYKYIIGGCLGLILVAYSVKILSR